MTTQIPGAPFDPDRTFLDVAPYLGSVIPTTTTTNNLKTSPFNAAPSYIASDSTWISDYLIMIYRKLVYDKAGGSGTILTAPDPIAGNAALAALTTGDLEALIADFYQSISSNPPTTTLLFSQLFVAYAQNKLGLAWPPNSTIATTYLTKVSDGLKNIIAANLGIWGVSTYGSFALRDAMLFGIGSQFQLQISGPQWPISVYTPFTANDDDSDKFLSPFSTAQGAIMNSFQAWSDDPAVISMVDDMVNTAFPALMNSIPWATIGTSDVLNKVVGGFEKYFTRFAGVETYFRVYTTFNSNFASGANEVAVLDFIRDIIANDPASFSFSKDFGDWYTKMQKDYLVSITGDPNGIPKSAMDESFKKVGIINRIYALIAMMIGIIQKTTAAQADALKVLTVLQGEMTNLIAKTHIFTSTDGSELNDTDATASTYRDELNQVVTAWVDTIRANRDFQKSAAQTQQSNVNNSNDAVNQQASMATALIQQLSTLLGAIYR